MFDALGKLTQRVDHLAGGGNGRSETFSVDSLNRFTQAVVYDHANPAAGSARAESPATSSVTPTTHCSGRPTSRATSNWTASRVTST